jgi:hypothetical protein
MQRQGDFVLLHQSAKTGNMVNVREKTVENRLRQGSWEGWGKVVATAKPAQGGEGALQEDDARHTITTVHWASRIRDNWIHPGAPMSDPYAVLGLPADSDDEAIRRRYLELVKQYSPEHHPEKFAAIRRAYESLRDLETRLKYRLFEAGKNESVEAILEDLTCRMKRHRLSLQAMLAAVQKT